MNTTIKSNETQFAFQLRRNIKAKIVELVREGTCGMSLENLRQVTPPPRATDGAPRGTNARWQYFKLFEEICAANRDIDAFILRERSAYRHD